MVNVGSDGSEGDEEDNGVDDDDDESESTGEIPAPQGGIGPRTCTPVIGGDPVTSRRDGKWDAG